MAALRGGPGPDTPVGLLSKIPIAAATLGRSEAVRYMLVNQVRGITLDRNTGSRRVANLANRMSLREGPQALDAEALGRASEALHLALMQSNPPGPGLEPVIRVFPAWPSDWDAAFSLLARGAFMVTSSWRQGNAEFVEIESLAGARCRLRNPWGVAGVTVFRNGVKAATLSSSLLEFDTRRGERITVAPSGKTLDDLRRTI